jgi:hypothetical protein
MEQHGYHCGRFDLYGFSTEDNIYPLPWKAAMLFISSGFWLLCSTVALTILTCFRQSIFGKSIHNLTGSAQVLSGILVMVSLFLHPLGWGANRVIRMCGPDAEAFYPAECSIGNNESMFSIQTSNLIFILFLRLGYVGGRHWCNLMLHLCGHKFNGRISQHEFEGAASC